MLAQAGIQQEIKTSLDSGVRRNDANLYFAMLAFCASVSSLRRGS